MCTGPCGQSARSSHSSAAATQAATSAIPVSATPAAPAPSTPFAVPTPLARCSTARVGLSAPGIAVPEAASSAFVGAHGITNDVTVGGPTAHAAELHIRAACRRSMVDSAPAALPTASFTRITPVASHGLLAVH